MQERRKERHFNENKKCPKEKSRLYLPAVNVATLSQPYFQMFNVKKKQKKCFLLIFVYYFCSYFSSLINVISPFEKIYIGLLMFLCFFFSFYFEMRLGRIMNI